MESKPWDVHVISSIHQDIGFLKSPETDLEMYANAYKKYVEIMERTPDPTYNSEFAYTVKYFIERYPEYKERLKRLIKAGRFSIGAQCSGFDPSFYSGEFIVRMISYAKVWLKNTFDYEPRFNHHADVPDFTPQIAQIYRKCEVDLFVYDRLGGEDASAPEYPGFWEKQEDWLLKKYFEKWGYDENGQQLAIYLGYWKWKYKNPVKAPVYRLWYYVALDGSKTLAYYPNGRYFGLYDLQFTEEEQKTIRPWSLPIESFVCRLNDETDPDRKALGIAGFDEEVVRIDVVAENCKKWNETHGQHLGVKLQPSTMDRFAEEIKKSVEKGITLGEYSGFAPGWSFGDASMGQRREWCLIENGICTAEKLAVICERLGIATYPDSLLSQAWEVLWVCSHNQKGTESSMKTVSKSASIAEDLIKSLLEKIASKIKRSRSDPAILVFNPLNGNRSEPVKAELTVGDLAGCYLIDSDGKPVVFNIEKVTKRSDGTKKVEISFIAQDVPSLGYKVYYLIKSPAKIEKATSDIAVGKNAIENNFYRISVSDGGLVSIYDKRAKREMVDNSGKLKFGHLVAEPTLRVRRPTPKPRIIQMQIDDVRISKRGDVSASLELVGTLGRSKVKVSFVLYALTDWLDIYVDIDWVRHEYGGRVYLPLPFNMRSPTLRIGVAYGSVPYYRPTAHGILREMNMSKRSPKMGFSSHWWLPISQEALSGSGFDWTYMQKWAHLSDVEYSVTLANNALRTGLVFKDNLVGIPVPLVATGHFLKSLPGWHFTIRGAGGQSWDEANASKFGWERSNPLLTTELTSSSGNLPEQMSFLQVCPESIILTVFKKSFDKKGYILRFFESADKDVNVAVKFNPALRFEGSKVYRTNLLERRIEEIKWVDTEKPPFPRAIISYMCLCLCMRVKWNQAALRNRFSPCQ